MSNGRKTDGRSAGQFAKQMLLHYEIAIRVFFTTVNVIDTTYYCLKFLFMGRHFANSVFNKLQNEIFLLRQY